MIFNIQSTITCTCGSIQQISTIEKFFIEIDIVEQLQNLFSEKTIIDSLGERFNRQKQDNDALEDLNDGKIYKKYCISNEFLKNHFNFSYTFNTDGCQASDNSNVSIWPIYIMLHEIPNNLRNKYMILVGLWVAKSEPSMNILQQCVDQANRLSTEGFQWVNNGIKITSKLFPLGCCVDSVARCSMLNTKRFNGVHGCTYCEHPTENIDGVRKYPMLENFPNKRTDAFIRNQIILAYFNKNQDISGVWGPSVLMNLKHFDLVDGMIIDFMHSCLLGVTNLYTDIIVSNASEEYYVGSPAAVHIINERLLIMKPPACVRKLPRSIQERNMWKDSEWLLWILFYAIPCLCGLLPKKYLNHLALFVTSLTILLNDSITKSMLQHYRKLLIKFVLNFGKLYGNQYMHYNVHLLLHICDTISNWGPLWAISTFYFENENKELLKLKKSNYEIATEMATRLLVYENFPYLENEEFVSNYCRHFCRTLYFQRSKKVCKIQKCDLLGAATNHVLSDEEMQVLESFLVVNEISECKTFQRMIYKSYRYTTSLYLKDKKRNNSVFETINSNLGIIPRIYLIKCNNQEDAYVFYKPLRLEPITFIDDDDVIDFINYKICTLEYNNLQCLHYSSLYKPALIMQSYSKYLISSIVKGAMARNIN